MSIEPAVLLLPPRIGEIRIFEGKPPHKDVTSIIFPTNNYVIADANNLKKAFARLDDYNPGAVITTVDDPSKTFMAAFTKSLKETNEKLNDAVANITRVTNADDVLITMLTRVDTLNSVVMDPQHLFIEKLTSRMADDYTAKFGIKLNDPWNLSEKITVSFNKLVTMAKSTKNGLKDVEIMIIMRPSDSRKLVIVALATRLNRKIQYKDYFKTKC